jgi:nitrogen fixation NifU-like protein
MRYSSLVLDHVKNPRNVGEIADGNAKARVRSSADGDLLQLHLKIEEGVIREAKFKVYGCGAAIAAGSMLTEAITGKTVAEVRRITNQQLSDQMGGLPPEKIHCSILAEQAIRAALEDYERE